MLPFFRDTLYVEAMYTHMLLHILLCLFKGAGVYEEEAMQGAGKCCEVSVHEHRKSCEGEDL